jgi:hypothetical protein
LKKAWSDWDDAEYSHYLEHERHMFAWVLERDGRVLSSEAWRRAVVFYTHEPPDAANRGLVFHDEAWHWAMLQIEGEGYWTRKPELEMVSAEYRAESDVFERGQESRK